MEQSSHGDGALGGGRASQTRSRNKFDEFGEKIKSIDIKKVVKTLTLLFGIVLIIFISFFDAKFDFTNIDWERWIARSTVLVGIMIFGILMGNSTGSDIQKEKIGGLFQNKCLEYNEMREFVKPIEDFFSSWWLFFKERKLIEKKVDYLIDMQIEMRVAKLYGKHLEKDDFVVGKMIFDETKPHEKIYQKELDSGEYVSNSNSCSLCKKMIINSGIKEVIIRDTKKEYRTVNFGLEKEDLYSLTLKKNTQ